MAFGTLKKFPEDFPVISEDNSLKSDVSVDLGNDGDDKLVLPTSIARFKLSIWSEEEMRLIRKKFVEGKYRQCYLICFLHVPRCNFFIYQMISMF